MIVLPDAENRTIVSSFVWTKHRNVTEGRTDRQSTDKRTDRIPLANTVGWLCMDLTSHSTHLGHFGDGKVQRRRKHFESGGAQIPARSAGKIFFTVPSHFFMVPPRHDRAL